jgi:hypothetical protein
MAAQTRQVLLLLLAVQGAVHQLQLPPLWHRM